MVPSSAARGASSSAERPPGRPSAVVPRPHGSRGPGPPAGVIRPPTTWDRTLANSDEAQPRIPGRDGCRRVPPASTPEFRSGFIDQVFRSAYHVASSAVSRRRSRRCSGRPADHLGDPHMHSQRGAKRCQRGSEPQGPVVRSTRRDTRLPTAVRVPSVAESLYLTDIRASPHREQQDRSCRNCVAVGNSTSTGSPDVGCPPAPRGSRRRGPGGYSGRIGIPGCA